MPSLSLSVCLSLSSHSICIPLSLTSLPLNHSLFIVAPHCGPTNARLRCHLSLVIPSECSIRVEYQTRYDVLSLISSHLSLFFPSPSSSASFVSPTASLTCPHISDALVFLFSDDYDGDDNDYDNLSRWREGECLLFDDSYEHSVVYGAVSDPRLRVVLIIDLWHPALTSMERAAIMHMYPPS
jgi:hypothetical protein